MQNPGNGKKKQDPLVELEKQVRSVMDGIKSNPDKRKQILIGYISHVYEAIKEAIHKTGSVVPHYVILADAPEFGGPTVSDEVIEKAKKLNAEAVVSVEGFESQGDMTDVIYHVSLSSPSVGVLGWVMKVKFEDGKAQVLAEKRYLFESQDKVKTLGELVSEMEEAGGP